MTIQELIYQFKLKYDKLDSNDFPKLEIPQIIALLNESQTIMVEKIYKAFEEDQGNTDSLEIIHIKDLPLINYTLTNKNPNEYSAPLPTNYLHLTRSYSYGLNEMCGTQILYDIQYSHNELNEVLQDTNRKPSYDWQEIPIVISQDKKFGYTDGTFTLVNTKIEYLRNPTKMDMAGYTHFDGSPSTNVNCEFGEDLQEQILSLALMIAKGVVQDGFGVQTNAQQLQIQN